METEKKNIEAEDRYRAVSILFNRAPEKVRQKYIESGVLNTVRFGKEYLVPMAEKLGISANALNKLINDGYLVEEQCNRGFFSRFFGVAVEMPAAGGGHNLIGKSLDKFSKWAEEQQKADAESRAGARADLKVAEGKRRMLKEKQACLEDVIKNALLEYKLKKQQKEAAETAGKKNEPENGLKIEVSSDIGAKRTPEEIEKYQKIREDIESGRKKRERAKKKAAKTEKERKKTRLKKPAKKTKSAKPKKANRKK